MTDINRFWTSEPTAFDPTDVRRRDSAAAAPLGMPAHHLWSGAGHDAKYVADVCPSGMIFVRSQGGLSHCEASTAPQARPRRRRQRVASTPACG